MDVAVTAVGDVESGLGFDLPAAAITREKRRRSV